jgi:hypothetical protein
MKRDESRTGHAGCPEDLTAPTRFLEKGRRLDPHIVAGLFRALGRLPWRLLLLLVGLLVQVVLTVLVWQLVDLSVSLMEVWAELARKHLEILLS